LAVIYKTAEHFFMPLDYMPLDYMVMDTQIFNLKLSVPTTSAYILICSLQQDGLHPTLEACASRWLGEPEQLSEVLEELLAWQIIEKRTNQDGDTVFLPNPASLWRTPGAES
jgi:hypothetical protein